MAGSSNPPPEQWSSRIGFVLAAIGAAVGLGSIWKFPYEVGAHGGGTFLIFYVLGLVLLVLPLMLAEMAIGRAGKGDAAASIQRIARSAGAAPAWIWIGRIGVLSGFLILSYYSVVGGWTIAYVAMTALDGLPPPEPAAAEAQFDALLASPLALSAYHAAFMAVTALIVARGVGSGIEAAVRILMPILVAILVGLAIYALMVGDVARTLEFLLRFDPGYATPGVVLEAFGLGFFSIGVGLGLMITYAAYTDRSVNLASATVVAIAADTAISIVSGLAVFPIVFAQGLDPAEGAGLVFVTLPVAFAAMPFGLLVAIAFFVLLFVAALASAISLLELVVAWLTRKSGWTRPGSALAAASACYVLGLGSAFSFNVWADWRPLGTFGFYETATFFDILDDLTSNVMLPLGGLAIAVFVGWVIPRNAVIDALEGGERVRMLLRVVLRWVAPLLMIAAATAPVFL